MQITIEVPDAYIWFMNVFKGKPKDMSAWSALDALEAYNLGRHFLEYLETPEGQKFYSPEKRPLAIAEINKVISGSAAQMELFTSASVATAAETLKQRWSGAQATPTAEPA